MADTREVRAFATEIKFVLDAAVAADVRRWARKRLEPDPHGAGDARDEYLTTSVYFDTERLDVFHRRGSFVNPETLIGDGADSDNESGAGQQEQL